MIIKEYEESYRDDLIFMILSAKDALGRKPGINEDLLHIKENYFNKGGNFWIAVDDSDRVIGSIVTLSLKAPQRLLYIDYL